MDIQEYVKNINSDQTKSVIKEVIKSLNFGNNRAAINLLYSSVICDLVFKIKILSSNNDRYASSILHDIDSEIEESRSSNMENWENLMLTRLFPRDSPAKSIKVDGQKKTKNEYLEYIKNSSISRMFCTNNSLSENIIFLRKKRNESSHNNLMNNEVILKTPNTDMVKGLIEYFVKELFNKSNDEMQGSFYSIEKKIRSYINLDENKRYTKELIEELYYKNINKASYDDLEKVSTSILKHIIELSINETHSYENNFDVINSFEDNNEINFNLKFFEYIIDNNINLTEYIVKQSSLNDLINSNSSNENLDDLILRLIDHNSSFKDYLNDPLLKVSLKNYCNKHFSKFLLYSNELFEIDILELMDKIIKSYEIKMEKIELGSHDHNYYTQFDSFMKQKEISLSWKDANKNVLDKEELNLLNKKINEKNKERFNGYFIKYLIYAFCTSRSFSESEKLEVRYIEPFYDKFTIDELNLLLELSNKNTQIYWIINSDLGELFNKIINDLVEKNNNKLTKKEILSDYPNVENGIKDYNEKSVN